MALPKVIHPRNKIRVPSTGDVLEFEPFTTQDEKAIILLDKSSSLYDKSKLQQEILQKCCQTEGFDFSKLSCVEITYLFLHLRKISVSGVLELSATCTECGEDININIGIDDIVFDKEKLKPLQFNLNTDDGPYIVTCSHIRVEDLKHIDGENIKFDDMAVVLRSMMKPDGNDIIEFTPEEKLELFLQLDATTAQKIVEYVNDSPKLEKKLSLECPECGHKFEGDLKDFFI